MSKVQAVPAGYAAVLPYLVIKNATAALDFYQNAFGAEIIMRLDMPSGDVMHAEARIGNAVFVSEVISRFTSHQSTLGRPVLPTQLISTSGLCSSSTLPISLLLKSILLGILL